MPKKRKKNKKRFYSKKDSKSLNPFRKRLYGEGNTPRSVFRDLHAYRDYKEMTAAAKHVSSSNNPYHRFIFGLPFAQSSSDIYSANYSVYTGDLERDLDWMSLSIIRYAREISLFIKKTKSFQKAFLLGSYAQANSILESITAEFGWSLWGIEKKFLLTEYSSGLEANKQLLAVIVGDESNDVLLSLSAEYVSLRCESKLSVENYRRRLFRFLADFKGKLSDFGSYLQYRLEPLEIDLLPIASLVTSFEGSLPVIDRYLTFLSIIQLCAATGGHFHGIAENIVYKISGKIEDSRIDALLQFFEPERTEEQSSLSVSLLKTLDDYTDGNYKSSASRSAELLIENPDIFYLYYIYIRSLDYLEEPFQQIFPQNSVAAYILEHSNVIIRGEKSWKNSSNAILKLTLSLWRDPLAYGLYDFYVKEVLPSPEKKTHNLALLNSLHFNPRFATIYSDPEKADTYLKQLSRQLGESSTLSLTSVLTVTPNSEEDFEFSTLIPEPRRRIYTAAVHEAAGRYKHAISALKPLLASRDNMLGGHHTCDRVTKALFRCYLNTRDLAECTDLVVHSYLKNELTVRKLPLNFLVRAIDETLPQNIMRIITYPILYSIVHTKARSVYVAYDNFLSSLGVIKPSQLFSIEAQFSPIEFREFLFKVCTTDVLACSYHFNGTKDLENERIHICQFLSERDSTNQKIYSDEISTITSRSLIREGIRQIDVSKIYVDEVGIRTSGRRLMEESFVRYCELASMSNIETLRMLNIGPLHLYVLTENGEIVKKPISLEELEQNSSGKRVVHNSHFLLFRELFLDVRDRFISSGDYGLDGYLSVRIRHGVLQNQIRSPFEALHLISEKDTTTGEYLANKHWDIKLNGISDEEEVLIQELLANFSREVDETAQNLNKELIQVKTEKKNPLGLFDYTFSQTDLYILFETDFVHIADFEQFLDGLFRVLWTRTKENLEKIRRVISEEMKNTIYSSISKLDREIRCKIAPNRAAELLQNIARCQTNLQYTLESIAQWFTVSSSNLVPQISIKDLVNICIESINNIYPHKKVSPTTKYEGEIVIDGSFFAPFFDIVRTLMDNVLVHSGMAPDEMGIEVEVKVYDNRLTIKIKNNLGKEILKSDPVSNLKKIHQSLKQSAIAEIIAREGRSGLLKVRKTIAIDLQRKHYMLDFSYDENRKFVVLIEMELEGLESENSNHRR